MIKYMCDGPWPFCVGLSVLLPSQVFPACLPPTSLGRLIPPVASSIKAWPFQDGALSPSWMAGASRHPNVLLYGLVGFC